MTRRRWLGGMVSLVLTFLLGGGALLFADCPNRLALPQPPVVQAPEVSDPMDALLEETLTLSFRQRFKAVLQDAQRYLENHRVKDGAVVVDLDETLLDNRAYFVVHKRYDSDLWERWALRGEAPAIPETLDFLKWLREQRLHVYFVTGRKESLRSITDENLRKIGVTDFDGLFMKPETYADPSAASFKIKARQAIEAKRQPVLLILGDQASDLKGGHGVGFQLPNPLYTIP